MALDRTTMAIGFANDVGNAIGNVYNNAQNDRRTREDRAWHERMTQQANLYNLPVNQLRRLQAAGLNPDLLYNDATNVAQSPTDASAPISSDPVQFGAMQEAVTQSQQGDLIASQANLNNAQAESIRTKLPEEVKEIQSHISKNTQEVTNLVKQLDVMVSDIGYKNSMTLLNNFNHGFLSEQRPFLMRKLRSESYWIDKLSKEDLNLKIQMGQYYFTSAVLNKAHGNYFNSASALNRSQIGVNESLKKLYSAEEQDYKSLSDLHNWQAFRVMSLTPVEESKLKAEINKFNSEIDFLDSESSYIDKQTDWYDIDHTFKIIQGVVNTGMDMYQMKGYDKGFTFQKRSYDKRFADIYDQAMRGSKKKGRYFYSDKPTLFY